INKTGMLSGIITATDIIKALLVAMNSEFTKLEALAKNDNKPNVNENGILESLQFPTVKYDFEHAGTASTELKNTLKKYGFANTVIRRASIVSYELELNQIIHSDGGYMQYTISNKGVEILARDRGPGIQDIQLALREGFSTANDWIRSIGFGAGLGLPNARKSSDEFSIDSSTRGTLVRAFIFAQLREL
ncbi:MAG TPA: histidine kinase, partial [Spirochaetia bacterium]|nr:histidine kinase [Spirochaetia bacterium]